MAFTRTVPVENESKLIAKRTDIIQVMITRSKVRDRAESRLLWLKIIQWRKVTYWLKVTWWLSKSIAPCGPAPLQHTPSSAYRRYRSGIVSDVCKDVWSINKTVIWNWLFYIWHIKHNSANLLNITKLSATTDIATAASRTSTIVFVYCTVQCKNKTLCIL